jgi:hypothetical protein
VDILFAKSGSTAVSEASQIGPFQFRSCLAVLLAGLLCDREWLLVDSAGNGLTQKKVRLSFDQSASQSASAIRVFRRPDLKR